ncbi:hypothetical protein GCM10027284_43320 [Cyclobacterium sediminis]
MKKILVIIIAFSFLNTFSQISTNENDSTFVRDKISTEKAILLNKKDTMKIGVENDKKQILFQFIEPEKTDYFKYIFPILTLLLGIGVNRFIDYLTNNKKIKKTAKRWTIELQNLKKPIERQINSIDEFLTEHKKEEFKMPNLKVETYLEGESFKSLDKTDLLKYLERFKKKKYNIAIEDVNQINSYVTVVRHHYTTLKEKYIEYKNGTSQHVTNLSKDLQELLKSFAIYGSELEQELNADPLNDQRYRPILDLFDTEVKPYMQDGNYDVFKLEKDFFIPLLSILANLRFDKRTHKMTESVQNCINDIKGIKMEKHYLTVNFENIKKRLEENKNELEKIHQRIE